MVQTPQVIVRHSLFRPLLLVVCAFLLLPLAIPLLFGSLFLGVAAVGAVFHLLPLLIICAGIYLLVTRRRRAW
jgi:hypothetical protein